MAKKGGRYQPVSKGRSLPSAPTDPEFNTPPPLFEATAEGTSTANTTPKSLRARTDQPPSPTLQQLSPWASLTIAELKPHLRKWSLPVSGLKAILVERLEKYQRSNIMDIGVAINRPPACPKKKKSNCKDKQPDNWASSKAKLLLINMHKDNKYPIHNMSSDEVYKLHPEFQLYPFDRFTENLKNLRAAVKREAQIIEGNHKDFAHDQLHFPRKEKTSRGEYFWDTHAANQLLQQDLKDIKDGRKEKLAPSKLRATRKAYRDFTVSKFCAHVHQEKRNQREATYWIPRRNKKGHQKH